MQGVSILTDSAGNPTVLTVDLRNYDEGLRPAVEALLRLVQELDLRDKTFGDDEPDYAPLS